MIQLEEKLENVFIEQHPQVAAKVLESISVAENKKLIKNKTVDDIRRLADHTPTELVAEWLGAFSIDDKVRIIQSLETPKAAEIISALPKLKSTRLLNSLPKHLRDSIISTINYPPTQAGALMDRRFLALTEDISAEEAIHKLRERQLRTLRVVFLLDITGRLDKYINIQDLLFARKETLLADIAKNIITFIRDTDNEEEVLAKFNDYRLTDLPVVNYDGKLIGIIRYKAIVKIAQDSALTDIQTMVGVSKEERALSPFSLVVKKRLLWLQINLITAFLAAAVVGIFESTISSFTALAVLLPVVAGQSGNTGAQALAVTMRGIALREVFTSQWNTLLLKEFMAAFINGIIIALTTGFFVYLWSHSIGLVFIIIISMIISMVIAAVAGTSIPLILTKLDMDPAQASSIILTTVTDVAGFFSFLGIASLLLSTIAS